MAKKKNEDLDKIVGDFLKGKEKTAKDAQAVVRAAKPFTETPGLDPHSDLFNSDWHQMAGAVGELDKMFDKEQAIDRLKRRLERGDLEVRVMQVGPDGNLTDVSDKVNPRDLRPDQIDGIQGEDGRELTRNPQGREEALRILQQLLPGRDWKGIESTSSIKKMEEALAESDKILKHWKR